MESLFHNQAVMKITCLLCHYSHKYVATEEQFEAYVVREKSLNQIFPDMPEEALVILDNGLYCKECNEKTFEQRAKMLNVQKISC